MTTPHVVWHSGADGHAVVRTSDTEEIHLRALAPLLDWSSRCADQTDAETLRRLGICAFQMALASHREAPAGFVLAAADREIAEGPEQDVAFADGVARIRKHLHVLRGEAGGTLADAGRAFVRARLVGPIEAD